MLFEDLEDGSHDGTATKGHADFFLVARVRDVDFEVRLVADMEAVDRHAFAEHDVGDELRDLLRLAFEGQGDGLVQSACEFLDVLVYCRLASE